MRKFIVLVLLVCGVMLVGCFTHASKENISSGIEGQVLLGPMTAVMRSDRPVPDKPYKAKINILDTDRKKIMEIETDDEGIFKVPLAPGIYIIDPVAPKPNLPPYPEPQKVTVNPGKFSKIIVRFDTGIR